MSETQMVGVLAAVIAFVGIKILLLIWISRDGR
jgi:hypothetical protein